MSALPSPETFLSGEPRALEGRRAVLRARLTDRVLDLRSLASRTPATLDRLAGAAPVRDVLVLSIYRPPAERLTASLPRLRSDRHRVTYAFGSTGDAVGALRDQTVTTWLGGGKFENLNAVAPVVAPPDWTIVVDDDVLLPERFLDRFVGLLEHFDLAMAQPAQTRASHAAWSVTRRRGGALLRETNFVEIGPVTAMRSDAAAALLPFPPLRYGWGLDAHWAAIGEQNGWRRGIVDSLPVRHDQGAVAATYSGDAAIEEAQRFLAERPYVPSARLRETLAIHRRA